MFIRLMKQKAGTGGGLLSRIKFVLLMTVKIKNAGIAIIYSGQDVLNSKVSSGNPQEVIFIAKKQNVLIGMETRD